MKNILVLTIIFALTGFLFSCQREVDNDLPSTNPNPATNDSILLAKYVELDTTFSSGQDTTNIYTFTYDNLKRIKRIYQVENFLGSPQVTYYITTDFFYTGSDTLPYKTIELDQEGISYTDTSFYTYSNGLVRSDSSVNYRVNNNELLLISTISFSATGNNIFAKSKEVYFNPAILSEDSSTLTIVRQNGNIITQQDPVNAISDDMQLSYDNKINPFFKADIHYPIFWEHLFNSFDAQKNNMTEEITSNSHVQYTYTYRTDGYPLTVRKTDLVDPTRSRKGFFFYTR